MVARIARFRPSMGSLTVGAPASRNQAMPAARASVPFFSASASEFIEAIVDDQARNYSKRVLGSFFTYTWLYEGKIPEMPNTIPPELLPK